ncbi:MAG: rubredoxin [Candidatus Absconditabacterales bacterium]
MKYLCNVCHKFTYELDKGDPAHGIPPSTAPEDLPDDWSCPICHNDKSHLKAVKA